MVFISWHLIFYVLVMVFLALRIFNEILTTQPDHYVGRPFVIRDIIIMIIITLAYGGIFWY